MSKLIGMELSVDAHTMLEMAVGWYAVYLEDMREILLRDGIPADDEVMQDDAKMIGTLRSLQTVLRESVSVYVVMQKDEP